MRDSLQCLSLRQMLLAGNKLYTYKRCIIYGLSYHSGKEVFSRHTDINK